VAELKPAYLIHGDDGSKMAEWRTRVRRRAEADRGPGGLEEFEPGVDTPDDLAAALSTLTFDTGTRYLLADDVSAWKAPALEPLAAALAAMPPDTVLVMIARGKPLKSLTKAVESAGGEVREHASPKPWELPRWAIGRAHELGLQLAPEAAKTLVALAGPSQLRLSRELEKLAIAAHPGNSLDAGDVERLVAGEATPKVYDLADALVAGDLEATVALAEDLTAGGERPSRFVYPVVNRVREVHRVVELLDAGVGEKDMAGVMKAPPWRVKKAVALAKRADRETLQRALCTFADLELDLRGAGVLDEETAVTLALAKAAA
jgi:DNA polymerase III subunit delta